MADEKAIIAATLAGHTEAFAELVRAHQARVRLVCFSYLGHVGEADDAAQDIFVKAFQALRNFRGEASFKTWLLKIADNHCRDTLRAKKRHPAESLDALLEAKGNAFESLLSRTNSDAMPPYSADKLDFLGRLFAALPEEDREMLTLREIEELSYEEIAERLGVSLDAVKGRLKRARQNLIEKCSRFTGHDTSKIS